MFVNQVSGTQSDRHALRFETDLEISQQTEWTLFSLFIQAPLAEGLPVIRTLLTTRKVNHPFYDPPEVLLSLISTPGLTPTPPLAISPPHLQRNPFSRRTRARRRGVRPEPNFEDLWPNLLFNRG